MSVISVLRQDADAVRLVHQALPAGRSRELDDFEYAALLERGMDVPFGNWADRGAAEIFLLRSEVRHA